MRVPEDGIPGAPRRGERDVYSAEDCVAAAVLFLDQAAPGQTSQKHYLVYASKNGLPSPGTFVKHGGYGEIMRQARAARRSPGGRKV